MTENASKLETGSPCDELLTNKRGISALTRPYQLRWLGQPLSNSFRYMVEEELQFFLCEMRDERCTATKEERLRSQCLVTQRVQPSICTSPALFPAVQDA